MHESSFLKVTFPPVERISAQFASTGDEPLSKTRLPVEVTFPPKVIPEAALKERLLPLTVPPKFIDDDESTTVTAFPKLTFPEKIKDEA